MKIERRTILSKLALILGTSLITYLVTQNPRPMDIHKYIGKTHCSLVSSHPAVLISPQSGYTENAGTYIRAEFYSSGLEYAEKSCEFMKSNKDLTPIFYTTSTEWNNYCVCKQ